MSAVSEVLHQSADIIERQGWTVKKGMQPGNGPRCLMGGIAQAIKAPVREFRSLGISTYCYSTVERHPAYQAVVEQIGEENIEGPWAFTWNDEEGRTAEDVIGVLRAAAVIEEARESQRVPVG
jgi:hypothetical protein